MDNSLSTIKQSKSGEEIDLEKYKWEGSSVEVKSDPLIDKQTGQTLVVRFFQYQANPELMKLHKPTKQQLFDSHIQQIKTMLWGDGLEVIDFINPRIITSKKKDQYRICITCKAKAGVAFADSPQSLQQLTK